MMLEGKIALVSGATRGVGRGIARGLGEQGATVYVTGRTTVDAVAAEVTAAGGRGIPVRCDLADDDALRALFERVAAESGRLDVLVNNAHSGVSDIADTAHTTFWRCDPALWDQMNRVGLRTHYIASVYAARLMAARGSGLIVNVSSFGALGYLFNVAYGVGKAALNRMTADMAFELREAGVAVVTLWPGMVRTEFTEEMMAGATPGYRRIFEAYGESPLVAGRAVAALAGDPHVLRHSGTVVIAAELARRLGLRDERGRRIESPRSLRTFMRALLPGRFAALAALAPPLRFPCAIVVPVLGRFSARLKADGGFRGRSGK